MPMKMWWVLKGKEPRGPFEVDDFRNMVPGFGPETLVAPDGATTPDAWKPARLYEEFRVLLKSSPPPLPKNPSVPGPPSKLGGQPQIVSVAREPNQPAAVPVKRQGVIVGVPGLSWGKKAMIGLVSGAVLGIGGLLIARHGQSPGRTPTQLVAQAIQAPAEPEDHWEGREQEAIGLVKQFHVHNPVFARCPRELDSVADGISDDSSLMKGFDQVTTWPLTTTIEDVIACDRLAPLALTIALLTKAQKDSGKFPGSQEFVREWRKEVRKNPQDDEELQNRESVEKQVINVDESWQAQRSAGAEYEVRVTIHEQGQKHLGPIDETHVRKWTVNLAQQTMKPLNAGAWENTDPTTYSKWAFSDSIVYGPLGKLSSPEFEAADVSAIAPTYHLASVDAATPGPVGTN